MQHQDKVPNPRIKWLGDVPKRKCKEKAFCPSQKRTGGHPRRTIRIPIDKQYCQIKRLEECCIDQLNRHDFTGLGTDTVVIYPANTHKEVPSWPMFEYGNENTDVTKVIVWIILTPFSLFWIFHRSLLAAFLLEAVVITIVSFVFGIKIQKQWQNIRRPWFIKSILISVCLVHPFLFGDRLVLGCELPGLRNWLWVQFCYRVCRGRYRNGYSRRDVEVFPVHRCC